MQNYIDDFEGGKEAALKHLMSLHGKSLRFFAYSIVHHKETAEEIVSDSFIKVWNARQNFKAADKIKAFLYISTRNACYDHLGAASQRIHTDAEACESLLSKDPDMLTQIIHAELMDEIYKELEKMPDQQALIFRLSYLEGLSTEEICERLNTSSANVYVARSKAIQTLRKIFKDKNTLFFLAFCFLINSH